MRAFAIEFPDEVIEAGLLLQGVLAWRSGGFLLERQVHALVPSVLVRFAGLDVLEGDAEPEPPH